MADVVDEFEFLARELPQIKAIFVEDDTLIIDEDRCEALSEKLIRRGSRLPFSANSLANISYDMLTGLRRAGLRLLCIGFESGDQVVP